MSSSIYEPLAIELSTSFAAGVDKVEVTSYGSATREFVPYVRDAASGPLPNSVVTYDSTLGAVKDARRLLNNGLMPQFVPGSTRQQIYTNVYTPQVDAEIERRATPKRAVPPEPKRRRIYLDE